MQRWLTYLKKTNHYWKIIFLSSRIKSKHNTSTYDRRSKNTPNGCILKDQKRKISVFQQMPFRKKHTSMPFADYVTHNAIGKRQREKTIPEGGREGTGEIKKNSNALVYSLRLVHFTFDWCSLLYGGTQYCVLVFFFFVCFTSMFCLLTFLGAIRATHVLKSYSCECCSINTPNQSRPLNPQQSKQNLSESWKGIKIPQIFLQSSFSHNLFYQITFSMAFTGFVC